MEDAKGGQNVKCFVLFHLWDDAMFVFMLHVCCLIGRTFHHAIYFLFSYYVTCCFIGVMFVLTCYVLFHWCDICVDMLRVV